MFEIYKWKKSELIMTVGITLLIGVISYFQLKIGEMKTRDAQRKADVELVARALRAFKEDHQIVPEATASGLIKGCGRKGEEACNWGGGPLVDEQNVIYMKNLPQDPFTFKGWRYMYDGKRLYVELENKNDIGMRKGLTIRCTNELECNWYVDI